MAVVVSMLLRACAHKLSWPLTRARREVARRSAEACEHGYASTTYSGPRLTKTALMLKVRVVVLPRERSDCREGRLPAEDTLEPADLAAATWTWESDRRRSRVPDTLPGAKRLFRRCTPAAARWNFGDRQATSQVVLTPDQRRLLDALMDQAALAIERVRRWKTLTAPNERRGRSIAQRAADLDLA
jgi:K+-sensing histidine kinase KdpD